MTQWKFLGLAFVAVIAACSANPCDRTSPCPNDTPSTQAQRDQCRATLQANSSAPCYSEVLSYINCQIDNIVCGGGGQTDTALTQMRVQNNCSSQYGNATACCSRNTGSTACQ